MGFVLLVLGVAALHFTYNSSHSEAVVVRPQSDPADLLYDRVKESTAFSQASRTSDLRSSKPRGPASVAASPARVPAKRSGPPMIGAHSRPAYQVRPFRGPPPKPKPAPKPVRKAPVSETCSGVTLDKQVFYGNSNVYSRKNGVKLDEMFWGKTPDVPPADRMSLQMCNMSSHINLHAAAKVNQMRHVEEIAVVADNVRADLSIEGADPGSILRERFNEWKQLNSSSDLQLREPGCARPLNFAFFMSSQVGSQLIRGFMTSDFIRAAGHSSVSILAKRGAGNPDPLREFRACNRVDVCVFIKWDSRAFPTLVAECKKRGAGVFIDYMDYCQTHQKNVAHFWPTAVDGFIVQSKYQEVFFREINFTKSVAIYHPHTNLDFLQNTVDRPPSVVGYTGHWRNLGASNKEVFDAVQSWGESRGVVFKSIDYTSYKGRGSGRGDIYKQRIYHVAVEGVDIAIVWPSAIIDREVFFKPVTRLVYWWSHGIPTIFYPTQSYAEISLALGYPLAARTTEEVLQWMEKLVESSEFRKTVSKIGIEGAKLFGMEGSAGQYLSAFCEYSKGGVDSSVPPATVYNGEVPL